MRVLFFLAAIFIALIQPVHAQDVLREHRTNDPSVKLLDKHGGVPQTVNEYANIYFENCHKANTETELDEYVVTQCACTASKLPEFMELKNMRSLFTKSQEGDFQQSRVMMLAYMPCLYESINEFVFDSCYYSNDMRKKMNSPRKICECYSHKMGDYIASKAEFFIPGMVRGGFDVTKAVPNPLAHIIGSRDFERQSGWQFEQCVMTESYGFK
ncbi:MAG: hypothetical protein DYH13_01845 [Alphaproteobacteria bacterium PRO2]|nr:hypothetical protein [Alphaproteobacteria bacterium PRO2]